MKKAESYKAIKHIKVDTLLSPKDVSGSSFIRAMECSYLTSNDPQK
jgi:hypothetical protein